jgi:Icc-related predicted phosphoesterase
MKLLLTADLHFRLPWFRWLIEQAPRYDLVCIAGDLLDMFKSETRLEQAREIRMLVRELAELVPVEFAPAIDDNAGRVVSHDRTSVYEWFIELGTHSKIITDGSTRKLENLLVTSIHCSRQEKQSGSIEVPQSEGKLEYRGLFFITFRPNRRWNER